MTGLEDEPLPDRRVRNWSYPALLARIGWATCRPLFAWSPRLFWGWRRFLLRLFGARIGRAVHIYPTVRILIPWHLAIGDRASVGDHVILYALGPIEIGEDATISQGAHLCAGTHDHRQPTMPLIKAPITIGARAWICADAFVGPGRRVGRGAVVGARAVVTRDVADGVTVAGNPARAIRGPGVQR